MTTARDLLFVAMDMPSARSLERGDLSLALAGAELIDLLGLGLAALDGDFVLPTGRQDAGDPQLDLAAAALAPAADGETVEDWLWRRGRGLSDTYLAALEADGLLGREERRRFLVLRTSRMVLADSPGRRRAAHRWAADDPTLLALASTIGISGPPPVPEPRPGPVAHVLTGVRHAVEELAAERRRRARRLDEARQTYVRRGF
ncbi:GPP34 family phosphoprotein [Actinacidiphila paucisporea]|uniref:Golgi phosphoprotein 3 (GPP34) n=1 Tax=Actinacidiphila paucisporea TaxID=310782 RepID=A0A1M7GWQ9_9ACTN|nr:GPP34 family phosphoprotein [Actinacidiphila paucisporea]SHM20630.1 Golgi phosphoprotein 3 (GPP34) [Actinacidiphila paucisporea]